MKEEITNFIRSFDPDQSFKYKYLNSDRTVFVRYICITFVQYL